MLVTLTIAKYPKSTAIFGLLSMAAFRLPLFFNRRITFWKLLGCGKNGTFDIHPDWRQWALLTVTADARQPAAAPAFIRRWWRFFGATLTEYRCVPFESHGYWDDQQPFGNPTGVVPPPGVPVGILTRATIRLPKLRDFWRNVPAVADSLQGVDGFIASVGIGEVPFVKQATFSVWRDVASVKQFAYRQKQHAEVIKKTRKNDWYSEELFARFALLNTFED